MINPNFLNFCLNSKISQNLNLTNDLLLIMVKFHFVYRVQLSVNWPPNSHLFNCCGHRLGYPRYYFKFAIFTIYLLYPLD